MNYDEYYSECHNMTEILKSINFKKCSIVRLTWAKGSYFKPDLIILKDENDRYGRVFGYSKYNNGIYEYGERDCAGCYKWKLENVMDENIIVIVDEKLKRSRLEKKFHSKAEYEDFLKHIQKNKDLNSLSND